MLLGFWLFRMFASSTSFKRKLFALLCFVTKEQKTYQVIFASVIVVQRSSTTVTIAVHKFPVTIRQCTDIEF